MHALPVHREEAETRRARALEPLLNSAVMLARSSLPKSVRVSFAHRLMRIHDRFATDCMDGEWRHALAHKICASFVKWSDELSAIDPVELSNDTACVVHSLPALLRTCRVHVEPWASDTGYCEALPPECADRTPLWGACELWGNPKKRDVRPRSPSSHGRHNTSHKHKSHTARENADGHARIRSHMADRLNRDVHKPMDAPVPQSASRRLARAPSDPNTRDSADDHVAMTALFLRARGSWPIRKCATQARIICVPHYSPRLRSLVSRWLPGCDIRARRGAPLAWLLGDECGAVLTWAPDAERLLLVPCEGVEPHQPANMDTRELAHKCSTKGSRPAARQWLLEPNDHVYKMSAADAVTEFLETRTRVCTNLTGTSRTWAQCPP